jgi:hypothetical protein
MQEKIEKKIARLRVWLFKCMLASENKFCNLEMRLPASQGASIYYVSIILDFSDPHKYSTAKRKLERLQPHHRFSKFEVPVVVNLKHIFELFWALNHLLFYLETIGFN